MGRKFFAIQISLFASSDLTKRALVPANEPQWRHVLRSSRARWRIWRKSSLRSTQTAADAFGGQPLACAGCATRSPEGRSDGGHDRDRTCDPYHVKVVLSR